ncbi:MAG: hypothetical protein V3S42_04990 [Candidatus Neomarinimicrobiota bacterium]
MNYFDGYTIRKVRLPIVTMAPPSDAFSFNIKMASYKLLIRPKIELQNKTYHFPQLSANDYKQFEIITENTILFDKNRQLMLKSLDNEPVKMQFRSEGAWIATIITNITCNIVIGFMLTHLAANKTGS